MHLLQFFWNHRITPLFCFIYFLGKQLSWCWLFFLVPRYPKKEYIAADSGKLSSRTRFTTLSNRFDIPQTINIKCLWRGLPIPSILRRPLTFDRSSCLSLAPRTWSWRWVPLHVARKILYRPFVKTTMTSLTRNLALRRLLKLCYLFGINVLYSYTQGQPNNSCP